VQQQGQFLQEILTVCHAFRTENQDIQMMTLFLVLDPSNED
jgi:hypothetical protein